MINFLKSMFGKKEEKREAESQTSSVERKASSEQNAPIKIPVITQAEEEEGHSCGSGGCGSGGCGCGH